MLGSLELFTSLEPIADGLAAAVEVGDANVVLLVSMSLSGDEAYDRRKEVIGNNKSSDRFSSGWTQNACDKHKNNTLVTHLRIISRLIQDKKL